MTTKETFEAIIEQADFAESNVSDLEVLITGADPEHEFETEITQILTIFDDIRTWANGNILEAEQAQVMAGFISELKVVFEKYTAKLETASVVDGYGVDWGNTNQDGAVQFTTTFGGVTSMKIINKPIITSEDLN